MDEEVHIRSRLLPLPPGEWKSLQKSLMRDYVSEAGQVPNIFGVFVRHPDLFQSWLPLITFLSSRGHLADEDRELIVNRIAFVSQSPYEWHQHAGRLDPEKRRRVLEGPDEMGWSEWERTLLTAVDQFCSIKNIDDSTWSLLAYHFTERQLLEFVFLCSQYLSLAYVLNTLGIQPESNGMPLPDFK